MTKAKRTRTPKMTSHRKAISVLSASSSMVKRSVNQLVIDGVGTRFALLAGLSSSLKDVSYKVIDEISVTESPR